MKFSRHGIETWEDELEWWKCVVMTQNETASTLFSFIPPPHQCKGYCICCWKFEVERGRETQRKRRRESKALPGFPPFGISRAATAWRERLHYLPPPTPLNMPRPQSIQQMPWRPPSTHHGPQTHKPLDGKAWGGSECRENGCTGSHEDIKRNLTSLWL